ncbi:Gm8251 [Phodopus roborovskii]|uniref:Gm8251 protein n=2 Tax=Phodopus roborovskii TaxID=109678 RepID=A0AAU9ZG21_PHORO|nr:Gm8251 [Phodopus roborovskii]
MWSFLDYWIFYNAWISILFTIFLGVACEIIFIKTCELFKKKLELWKNGSSCSQRQNEDDCQRGKILAIECWSISQTSSTEKVETFSGRVTTSPPYVENADNIREEAFSSNEYEYQESHFCETRSSSCGTSTSLSMFHSKVKNFFMRSFHRKYPQSEYQSKPLSSNNLFSIMKTNRTKTTTTDAVSFQSTLSFTRAEDLNVTPCPPVHLFLSSDQIRHVEENVRRKIPVNPKAMSGRDDDCLHLRSQEPLVQYQHPNEELPAKALDTFLDQNAMQNQLIYEQQFTTQTQQCIHNQESVISQPGCVQPLDVMRLPFSSSTQDSFQAQQIDHKDKSQHFNHIPCIVETEDSTKGTESDEYFSKTQCSVYFNDQNKSNHLVTGQNSIFQNADFLSSRSNSLAEEFPQQKVITSQQTVTSLESNQYYAHSSMSLSLNMKRQRNRRKIPDNERKVSLKVPPPKAKKTSRSQVLPIIVCHTSENKIKLRCKKKNMVHQKKIMSDIAMHLISVSKLITPHVKKYFLKCLVAVIPDLITCEHILQGQNKSLDMEKINYTRADKHTDRDKAAGPMPEKSSAGDHLIETTKCRVPFCEKPIQTLDGHSTEDEVLIKDVCAVATRPFKVRKKSSGPKSVLGVKHKFIVKKRALSLKFSVTAHDTQNHRRKVGDGFESVIKQMLHDVTLAPGLLNVHPQRSSIHNNKIHIKIILQKTQVERKEKNMDSLNTERKAVDPLEVQLCHGVEVLEQVPPEIVAHTKRSFRFDACPVKEIKTEKEMFQATSFTEAVRESVDSLRMDSFCVANTKTSTATQTEPQCCAELELDPLKSGKLLTQDSLSQSNESNVPNNRNDTREISCGSNQNTFSCSVNYCMPVLTHSKKKKDQTRFTNMSSVRIKYMNKVKPPISKPFNITGNKKKSKLDLKIKLKRVNQAKAFLLECQNTFCLSIHRSLHDVFCHAQLKQGELTNRICVAESSAFYNREKKFKEGKENPFVQAASQHSQHGWADGDQSKKTLTDEPDPSPISLSQEQSANCQGVKCQKDSLKSTLEISQQMAPIQAEELQTTTKTENGINLPMVPKILSLETGTSSPGEFTNMTNDGLESDKNFEHELELYPAEKDSETYTGLQVTFLSSSDSVTRPFVSRPKGKRKALRSNKQMETMRQRYRTMREIKSSVLQSINCSFSKKPNHKEMKYSHQRGNIADACLDFIHYKVHILSNKKRNSKPRIDKQRIRRLGHMERTQEKSPDGRNIHCLGSADLSSSCSMKNYDEEAEEPDNFQISENSPSLIYDMYRENDHDQVGRTITQVQAQTPAEIISCSTLFPIPEELQLEKLEGCVTVSPLTFGETKDGALSEGECDLSDERRHKGQAADSEKVVREFSASCTHPTHSGELKCDSTKVKGMYPGGKCPDETSDLTDVALDINMSSKIETEEGTSSKKTPCSIQRKPVMLLREGKVTSDDIKEVDLQSKEKENGDDTLLKSFLQYSQHCALCSHQCSHQSRDPNSHELRKQGGKNILSIVEQDIPQPSQTTGLTQRECATCTSSFKVPLIQSEESQMDEVNTDRTKSGIPADGTHAQKLNSWDRLEREGLENELQATITESLTLSTPNILRYKRKIKVSPCKALQGKMCSTGITMKGRKTSVSKILTIPQCGLRKHRLPKTLKSQIYELFKHPTVTPNNFNIKVLKDPTAENNKILLIQELAETMLESLDFSTPTSKERENLKLMDMGSEMSNNCLSVKTRKATISQALTTAGCGTPKQGKLMAGLSLNAIFSPMPVSLDLNTCGGIQDRGVMWKMSLSPELHDQSEREERAQCTHHMDKDTSANSTKDKKGQGGEEGPLTSQYFGFSAESTAGPSSVQSGLQLIDSATYPELERALYDGQAEPVNVNNIQSSMVDVTANTLSIQSLYYSEVDTRINGEEAMQITQSSHHPKLQQPSDIGEIIYTNSNFEPILNNGKCSIEYSFQKEEVSTTPEKNMHLKEKPSVLQKIQLDITEPGQEVQKIKDEINVVETSTSTWMPSCLKSETRIEKADAITKVTLYSLAELSLRTLSATLGEVSEEWVKAYNTSATLKREDHMPQKAEHEVEIFDEKVTMHTTDKGCKGNKTLSQDLFSSSTEQGELDPQIEDQEKVDGKDKKEQNCNNDGKDQEQMGLNYTNQEKCSQDDREENEKNPEGREQGEAGTDGQEQEEGCPENREQETWNHKCDTQGELNPNSTEPGKADQQGESKEKVAPKCLPSKSPHKLMSIRAEGEEERQGTIKSANSQLQHQKLLETGKTEQTESTEDDGKSNVKIGKQCESQTWMDSRKLVQTKDVMHPKDTSSNKNQIQPSYVPRTTGHYGTNATDEQTNVHENLGPVQERNCELGEGLTLASLPHSKVDIEIKEIWIETGSFSPYSQSMESSDAETSSNAASSLNNIVSDSKSSRYISYKEENGKNTFEGSTAHSKAEYVNINKSPLSYVPEIKRPKLHLEEKSKKKPEGRKEKGMSLKEVHSVITSSDVSTLDKAEAVETEVRQRHVPHSVSQESLPVGQVASTESISNHAKRRKLHLPCEEEEVQTSAIDGLARSSGKGLKAKMSANYHVLSVKENNIPRKRKTFWRSSKEKTGQKQGRTGGYKVFATKNYISKPSIPHHGLSPQQEHFLMASCTGELTHAGSNEGIILPNVISKANIQELYDETKARVTDKDRKDSISLRERLSPPIHFNDSMPPFNIREQRKKHKKGKGEPIMIVLKEAAPLPFPSFLKSDTRVNEEEGILGETQISFLPPTIKDKSESDKKACMESPGNVLSNRKEPTHEEKKNKPIKDVKDKEITNSMDQTVKKLPWSHTPSIKEFQRKTQMEKLVDMANIIVALSISQLQLNTFLGAQIAGREVYSEIKLLNEHMPQKEKEGEEKHVDVNSIMHAKDIYWKTKKSPTLPMQNLNDQNWKSREQEGKVKDRRESGVALTKKSTKTSTAMPPQPILIVNAGIMEKCTPVLTRSSVSLGYLQKSSDSEGGIYKQPITGDTPISIQNEKEYISEEKDEDKQGLVPTKSSSLLQDLFHSKFSEKIEFKDTKSTLKNSALQRLSTKGETLPREAIVDDTTEAVQKQHMPQREETYRKEIDRRYTDVILKSLLSQKLQRTELPIHINSPKTNEQDKSEPQVLRKMFTSIPSTTKVTLCKAVQVDEERPENGLFDPFPQTFPALSDANEMSNKEDMCGRVRKGKPCTKQKVVDLTIGMHCKSTKVSPISYLLNTKEFVLNMKVLEKKVHKDKSELAVVATRSFLSILSPPSRYSQEKTQRDTARDTGHSYPQGNFQKAADAQETENGESAEDNNNCIVKTTQHNVLQNQARSQKSKSVSSVHRISELPQVDSECESAPPDLKIDLTTLGTIKRANMLEMSFKGQKGQPEKCEKEPSTKIGSWKKENEIKDNLSHKTSPKFPVSPVNKLLKEALTTSETLVCSKGPVTESRQEIGSARSTKPEKDRQNNANMSKMLLPKETSQNKEENVNMKEQAIPHRKSGEQTKQDSFPLLIGPVYRENQRIPLQTDVDRKSAVNISPQMQSGAHMRTAECNATRRTEDPPLIVLEQEQCDLALPQKSHDSVLNSEPRNLCFLCLQTRQGVVAESEDLNIIHKPDMNTTEQEEIGKDIITPPECPFENQTSKMMNMSLKKYDSHQQRAIPEDYSCKVYLKIIKMNFRSPKVDNRPANLKIDSRGQCPPLDYIKTPTMNVSNSSSKVMVESKGTEKQESVTSFETWSNPPSSHILHKFSEKEKEDLLVHFSTKALERQATGLPRIVAQSYAMANAQDKSKPLFKCIHSTTKEPKRTNRVLVLFDERSFCEIDHDLQCKYLRSIARPITVVSKPNVLPKHTSKSSMGSGLECEKVENTEESSILSFDKEPLQYVPFQKKNSQQSSLLTRKFQEPASVPAFYPDLQGTEQNDMTILSDLKFQMTSEKDKQYHVWFQETSSYKHSVSGTQQNTSDLAGSYSSWISDDWTNDVPLNTETLTDLVECPASEESDSEECVFIETNFYLTQDSQKFLFEVPKGIPLADTHKVDETTLLKPFYCGDPNDYHTRTHRKRISPVTQSCYQSQNTRKYRINSKMQSPDWLSHSSSNTVEIESTKSCITWNEDWTSSTWSKTSYSLTSSTTESNIKLNVARKHGKSYMYPQFKERRTAKSDLWRKSNVDQSSNYSHSHSEEQHPRRKRPYHYESKEQNPQTNQMPEPSAHWQNIKFYSEREKQPFLYACIPADSMDVIPQTIRWVIPPKILQQRNFLVPQVANISKSWNLLSSSKKLLRSLAWAINRIRYR